MTMSQLASSFTGAFLKEGVTSYEDVWDAGKIQGCVCDEGYEGYDCSRRTCPSGANPRLYSSDESENMGDHGESVVLQCQADDGFFRLQYGRSVTPPLPHSASPQLLESVLEGLASVDLAVSVSMDEEAVEGVTSVCNASSLAETTITFEVFPLFLRARLTLASVPPL